MILLLTDLHFGLKKFSDKIYNLQMDYIKDEVFSHILENNIKTVIHCGDIIDDPEVIENKLLQNIKTDFISWFEEKKVNLYLLTGNHDCFHKESTEYNFNKVLSHNCKYVKDVSDVTYLEDLKIAFVPHSKSFSEVKGNPKVIFAHHDVKDVTFNVYQKSKKGLSVDELEKLNCPIIIGHYHNQSVTKNCRYIGTLFQHTWGEFGFRKGFWILKDVQKLDLFNINEHLSFIEQTVLPRHIKIEYIQEGNKQPTFIIDDGIQEKETTKDYNKVKDIVSGNHIELKAENYNVETKYLEMLNDLNSVCYSELNILNNKRLNKAIEQMLELQEEDDIENDSNIVDLCKHFFDILPDSLENKEAIRNLFLEKIE
jgi:predicted phosphodiesterase